MMICSSARATRKICYYYVTLTPMADAAAADASEASWPMEMQALRRENAALHQSLEARTHAHAPYERKTVVHQTVQRKIMTELCNLRRDLHKRRGSSISRRACILRPRFASSLVMKTVQHDSKMMRSAFRVRTRLGLSLRLSGSVKKTSQRSPLPASEKLTRPRAGPPRPAAGREGRPGARQGCQGRRGDAFAH